MVNKDIERKIEIPKDVEVEISGNKIKVKRENSEIEKRFAFRNLKIEKRDNEIEIVCKTKTKRERKLAGTIAAHIKNMIAGVRKKFVYKLEICNVHFPMNVKIEGEKVIIKSFLGETTDRYAKIMPGANVEVKGTEILVSSLDKEAAGQTASNIEKATKVRKRDRRIFQDGIFITKKPGREK